MAGYNFHYYLDDYQAKLKKEERTETTVILWVRKAQFKIKYRTSIKVRPDQWEGAKEEVRRNKSGYASDNNYLLTVKTGKTGQTDHPLPVKIDHPKKRPFLISAGAN